MNAITDNGRQISKERVGQIRARLNKLCDIRLSRLKAVLDPQQSAFLELLPLLFHTNQAGLPGFVSKNCPADLPEYTPSIQVIQLARERHPDVELDWRVKSPVSLSALYLVGRQGTLCQGGRRDMEIWVCYAEAMSDADQQQLASKARLIEDYAAASGLPVTIRIIRDADLRADKPGEMPDDGADDHTDPHHLREWFYRTAVLLAGVYPVWWLVPQEQAYASYVEGLYGTAVIGKGEWLDFGDPAQLPADEFVRATRKLLLRGLESPYPALNEMSLSEIVAGEYPRADGVCVAIKAIVLGQDPLDAIQVDPDYRVLERVLQYHAQQQTDRAEIARRGFYAASGVKLSRSSDEDSWRVKVLRDLARQWGWDEDTLERLDDRQDWSVQALLEEQGLLVDELSQCFKSLNAFAVRHLAEDDTERLSLSLVGRKIYATVGQRPGKVDLLPYCGGSDLHQAELFISNSEGLWQLRRLPPMSRDSVVLREADSLVEILAWVHVNQLADLDTAIALPPVLQSSLESEPGHILATLSEQLPALTPAQLPLERFSATTRARLSLVFLNIGTDPLGNLSALGLQRATTRSDPLSFSGTHKNLLLTLDHLVVTQWDEILVVRYARNNEGLLDMLCRHLNLADPLSGGDPASLQAFCFTSARADALAERVNQLADNLVECFKERGAEAGYLLQIEDSFYLLEQREGSYRWRKIGDKTALVEMLRDPRSRSRPLVMDPVSFVRTAPALS